MKCVFAYSVLNAVEERRLRSRRNAGEIARRLAPWPVIVVVIGATSPSFAQVIPTDNELTAPPWNAQQVFEPTPLPQLDDPDNSDGIQPEDMPVKTRQQPGYEPVGIRAGSWMFNPSLMSGMRFDSNVFSSNTMKRSDFAAIVAPSLRAHTLWERHGIDLKLSAQSTIYNENSSLNQTNYGLKGSAWYDIAHDLKVLTSFQASHLNEGVGTLSSPVNAISPTPYDLLSGDITVRKEFNRLAASFGMGVDAYDFGSARAQNGSIINQDARDGQIYTVHGRLDYAFSPKLGWFTGVEGNQREIRGTPGRTLDSQGYRALSGVTVALTNLITGEIGFGYARQSFDDSTIGTIEGPAYRAMLMWRPTRLLDVHFRAEQIVTQTSDTSSTGVQANALQLGADYELRRNVVLSVAGGYERDKFFGQARNDKVLTADSRIKYLLNRHGAISLYHRYTERNSDIPTFSFDKHQVGINVTAQF
ncbi:outer membrane beta-barrel protein [Afipia sp. Root123D2]|uniref:outer membrane beta-barrel protein n=1 Tax=Afipia sp. Root123D2 TaxID=1736436 RepID=UPI0009E68F16|nr:outer membrane beta-barrel protein [Afipia sp. Root123D2]